MLGPHAASPPAALNPAEQLFQTQAAAAAATLLQLGGFHTACGPVWAGTASYCCRHDSINVSLVEF